MLIYILLYMTNHNTLQNSYTGIYLERSGVHAAASVEVLLAEPEVLLSDNEKNEVYQFEADVFNHRLDDGVTVGGAIRAQRDEETVAPFFFSEAFIQGLITMPSSEGDKAMPTFETANDVYVWLATSIADGALSHGTLVSMAKSSAGHYASQLTGSLSNEVPISDNAIDRMPLVLQPEKFIKMTNDVQKARHFVATQRQPHATIKHPIDGAKRAIVDTYTGKINSLAASNVPMSEYLYLQSSLVGDEDMMTVARESIPKGLRNGVMSENTRPGIFRRLDYIRNGMGYDSEGKSTAVSDLISSSASEVFAGQVGESESHFTPEQLAMLKQTMLTPEQQQGLFSNVLNAAGLLEGVRSDEESSDTMRFEVVVNKAKSTFMVSPGSKEFRVSSTPRSLYDTIVVGGFHELEHINQALADKQFGDTLKIAGVRGKRIAMLREGGANSQQRQAELKLFGQSKPVASLTYANALKAIEAGGGIEEAAAAFYAAKCAVSPAMSKSDAAAEAADRVLRLVRQGGKNSKAMSYAEEAILHNETAAMEDSVRARATAVTCLDLSDQLRLHRFGLLPSIDSTHVDWTPYVLEAAAPYIDEALSEVK